MPIAKYIQMAKEYILEQELSIDKLVDMALGNDSTLGLVSNLNDALDPIDVNDKDSSAENQ